MSNPGTDLSAHHIYEAALALNHVRAQLAAAEVENLVEAAAELRQRHAEASAKFGSFAFVGPAHDLARRLALPVSAIDFLWAVVAATVDPRIVAHLETLGGSHARRGLSVSVYAAMARLAEPHVAELAQWLSRSNPLIDNGLITATEQATAAARPYAAAPRLVAHLAALPTGRVADDALIEVVADPVALVHDDAQRESISQIRRVLQSRHAVIVIEGARGSGRATAAALAGGRTAVLLDCAELHVSAVPDALLPLRREACLRDVTSVLANADQMIGADQGESRAALGRFIDRFPGHLIVTAASSGIDLATTRPLVRVRWGVPSIEVRRQLWERLGGRTGDPVAGDLEALAMRYRVGPGAILRAVESAEIALDDGGTVDAQGLTAGLRHNISERLGALAERVEVTQTWDDLVIGEDTRDQIAALISRVKHAHSVLEGWGYRAKVARGTGIAALFSGAPGTGKTMVAGLIARALDLDVYQVELSKVVSKWVGETEKQLAQLFDAAEEGHALLLFDEADALFGQRSTEMKSAVDRYANLEVNYLLQRVEAFNGITILTTNLDANIDRALKRRLAGHIVFAAPDEDERAALWQRLTHTQRAPIARDVDHGELARSFPNMTGANIRNAALSGAFLAASESSREITHEHLVRAARSEYRSMGHVLSDRPSLGRRRNSL